MRVLAGYDAASQSRLQSAAPAASVYQRTAAPRSRRRCGRTAARLGQPTPCLDDRASVRRGRRTIPGGGTANGFGIPRRGPSGCHQTARRRQKSGSGDDRSKWIRGGRRRWNPVCLPYLGDVRCGTINAVETAAFQFLTARARVPSLGHSSKGGRHYDSVI